MLISLHEGPSKTVVCVSLIQSFMISILALEWGSRTYNLRENPPWLFQANVNWRMTVPLSLYRDIMRDV